MTTTPIRSDFAPSDFDPTTNGGDPEAARALRLHLTDALAARSAATILGTVVDIDAKPSAMEAFING